MNDRQPLYVIDARDLEVLSNAGGVVGRSRINDQEGLDVYGVASVRNINYLPLYTSDSWGRLSIYDRALNNVRRFVDSTVNVMAGR